MGEHRARTAVLVVALAAGMLAAGAPAAAHDGHVHAEAALAVRLNFQPAAAPVPAGYTADVGEAFDAGRGYGWVTQGSSAAQSMVSQSRKRNLHTDQRLDTVIHAQPGSGAAGRWEIAVPAGMYRVSVAVGDPGYLDSIHRVALEGRVAVAGFTPTSANRSAIATIDVPVSDGRLTLDTAGGTNTKIHYVHIDQLSEAPPPNVATKINFQPASSAVPSGYVPDSGAAFTEARGFGWIAQSSSAPQSMASYSRERGVASDQRLDTVLHMQPKGMPAARWEIALSPGQYRVTVGVGDPSYVDSTHQVAVEGTVAISKFVPTSTVRSKAATVTVSVTDGRLTLDAAGGTNTKINYVDINPPASVEKFTWTQGAVPPIPRTEAGVAQVGDSLWLIGGFWDRTWMPTRRVDVYDMDDNTWRRAPDAPIGSTHAGIAVVGTDIYVGGGYIEKAGGGQTYGTTGVWRLDTTTGLWSAMPGLPLARGSGGLVALDRKLHFFGGVTTGRSDVGNHWIFDLDAPASGWVTSVPLPNPRSHFGALAFGGKVWAIGGQHKSDSALVTQASVHVWDPATPTAWSAAPSLPTGLSHISGSTLVRNGKIMILGGETAHGARVAGVLSFDPATGQWSTVATMPKARYSGAAGSYGGKLFHTGGSSTVLEVFIGTPS